MRRPSWHYGCPSDARRDNLPFLTHLSHLRQVHLNDVEERQDREDARRREGCAVEVDGGGKCQEREDRRRHEVHGLVQACGTVIWWGTERSSAVDSLTLQPRGYFSQCIG